MMHSQKNIKLMWWKLRCLYERHNRGAVKAGQCYKLYLFGFVLYMRQCHPIIRTIRPKLKKKKCNRRLCILSFFKNWLSIKFKQQIWQYRIKSLHIKTNQNNIPFCICFTTEENSRKCVLFSVYNRQCWENNIISHCNITVIITLILVMFQYDLQCTYKHTGFLWTKLSQSHN